MCSYFGVKVKKKGPWKKLQQRRVYKNPWLEFVEHLVINPSNKEGVYGVLKTNGPSVLIAAMTESEEIYIIGQHRFAINSFSWGLPGGNAGNEHSLVAAKRELQEETGLIASNWEKIGRFHSCCGVVDEISHVFMATGLCQTKQHKRQEEGITKLRKVTIEEIIEMINDDKFLDGQSITALFKVFQYLRRNFNS